MDLSTAAALANFQFLQAYQSGGSQAAIAQGFGSAQDLAAQEAALLPQGSGPAALLELTPQALFASANYSLAAQAGQGQADVQALLQQATAVSAFGNASLLPGGTGFQDPAQAEAFASYKLLQAERSGTVQQFLASSLGNPGAVNLLA